MKKKDKENKTLKGEIVKRGDEKDEGLMRRESEGLLAKASSKISIFSLRNKIQEKAISSFRKVVQEKEGLAYDLVGLEKAKQRLRDVDIEIEEEHIGRITKLQEAQNKLQDTQREFMLNAQKDEIAKLKLEADKGELLERINKIKQPEKQESKTEELKKELEEKIKIKEVLQDYEIKKFVLKFKQGLKSQQAIDKVFSELVEEILQGRDPSELSGAERKKYENLEDFYNNIYDEM